MINKNKRIWRINTDFRATCIDFGIFYTEMENALNDPNGCNFEKLYNVLNYTARVFPDMVRFLVTGDSSILESGEVKFDQNDIQYFRNFIRDNKGLRHIAAYILGRRYMSEDIGFFSQKDRSQANRYRKFLYPAHVNHSERNWYGYPLPDTYNLSEAVRMFEYAIAWGAGSFIMPETFGYLHEKKEISYIQLFAVIAACIKLDFLNVLPSNTDELVWVNKSQTFWDIATIILNNMDMVKPWASNEVVIDGKKAREIIKHSMVRRLLQIFNIQNANITGKKRNAWSDSEKLHIGVQKYLARKNPPLNAINDQVQRILSNISSVPTKNQNHGLDS